MTNNTSRTTEEQRNIDFVLAMFANVSESMDSSTVDHYIAADYIQHNPAVAPGRDSLKVFLDQIKKCAPMRLTISSAPSSMPIM